MKMLLMLILLFNVVACNGQKKKSVQTKAATPIEKPVNAEVVIIQEETPAEPLPPVVIADPIPQREEEIPTSPEEEETAPSSVPTSPITEPEIPTPEKISYDFNKLKNLGIHIVGRSILHEIRNPAVIYCSNTQFLNHEKIEELKILLATINTEDILLMDDIKVASSTLKSLIEKSIPLLEAIPYSRFCPRIYLAIDAKNDGVNSNDLAEP